MRLSFGWDIDDSSFRPRWAGRILLLLLDSLHLAHPAGRTIPALLFRHPDGFFVCRCKGAIVTCIARADMNDGSGKDAYED